MRSIRHELSIRLLTGVFLLLAAAGTALAWMIHGRLVAEFDSALLAKARALSALTSREGRGIEIDYSGEHLPEFEDENQPEYFEMTLREGPLIARSPRLRLSDTHLPRASDAAGSPRFQNLPLPDGRNGRLVQIAFRPRVDPGEEFGDAEDNDQSGLFPIPPSIAPDAAVVVLTVARSRQELDRLQFSINGVLVLVTIGLLAAIALLVRHATRRALHPIAAINARITEIGPQALDQRIQLPDPPEELRTIIATVNRLLDRLERAFEREHRFSGDVAHELRTPVSELRAACEVGGAWPDDPESTRQFFSDIRDIALQMETTVNNLLLLASCENGTLTVTEEPVVLDQMIRTCWSRTAAGAAARAVHGEFAIDPAQVVRTDSRKVEMVVQNLVGNAAAYAVPGTAVRFTASNGGAHVDLCIENNVDNLAAPDMQHLFDRFWRKDPARSGAGHAGLGLSIAKALADSLGIDLRVELTAANVFSARLTFRLATS